MLDVPVKVCGQCAIHELDPMLEGKEDEMGVNRSRRLMKMLPPFIKVNSAPEMREVGAFWPLLIYLTACCAQRRERSQ